MNFNTSIFQTILTALITISTLVGGVLLSLGCHDIAGSISCVGSNAPTWLSPYLIIATSVLGIIKLITSAFEGKLVKQTAVISTSGKTGTVLPSDVAK